MKKVLSIVLSLVMVICMMPVMAFAGSNDAVYSDIAGEKCEGAVSVLSALGVVDGYENGTYKPEQTVTRAEMAKLVITALGMDSYATATKSSYSDMANAQWAIPVVEYATNLGIIEGVGGGRFSPGNPVTYEQAATMIVRAIGFTTDCNEMNGTWPAIYVQKATALGLFENVEGNNYGTGANRGDVAIMLYNALNTPMVYADKDGQTLTKFGKDGDVITMMTTLNKNGTVEYGVLTPEDADDALTNVRSLIGAAGKIIKNKDGKVLSIGDIQTQFLTGDYNASTKKFEVGDTDYTIASDAYSTYGVVDKSVVTTPGKTNVTTFKNNAEVADSNLAALGKGTYTIAVKVSGKTIKNIYSIASWSNTAASKATASQLKKITSDKSLLGYDFALNDDNVIDNSAFELLGVDSLDKIAEDNIVAVYATNDSTATGTISKIEVGTEVVTGKVTKIKTNDDPKKTVYTIGDKEYKESKLKNAESLTGVLNVGDEVTLYLDYSGKIYKTDSVETGYLYGIVLKAKGTDSGYDDTDNLIKVLQADGKEVVLTIKNSTVAATINAVAGDLVRYKLNSDNKVTEMVKSTEKTGTEAKYNNGVIDGKICADDMIVFIYNGSGKDDADNYKVAKASSLTDEFATAPYFINKKSDITAILVDEEATNATDTFGPINSKSNVQNAKDDPVFQFVGVANGVALDALTKDNTGTYTTDWKNFVVIDKSGDEISGIKAATMDQKDKVQSESAFEALGDGHVAMFKVAAAGYDAKVASGNMGAYKVTKVDGDRVQVAGGYQTVKDAKVYIPTLDSDNTFEAWTIGSLEDIDIDGYIVLLQTNKKSSNWDTVVFIPDTVAADCPSLIPAWN